MATPLKKNFSALGAHVVDLRRLVIVVLACAGLLSQGTAVAKPHDPLAYVEHEVGFLHADALPRQATPTPGIEPRQSTLTAESNRRNRAATLDTKREHLKSPARAATPEQRRILRLVKKLAPQFKVDPRLVMAVISAESGFDPGARSPKHAVGLMQLIPETAERFSVKDATDPVQNLKGGLAYLRWLLSHFRGNVTLALAGYNAGEGTVSRYGGVPPYPETQNYVEKVLAGFGREMHPYDPSAAVPSPIFRRTPTLVVEG